MRMALSIALALCLTVAAVRAVETPKPIPGDGFVDPRFEPARPVTLDEPFGMEAPRGQAVTGRGEDGAPQSRVLLKADSIEIKTGSRPTPMSAEPMAFVVCDNVTATTDAGATKLKCTNCKLSMPNGLSAKASEITFDSSTNVLTLTGSDESPVTVSVAGTTSKTAKLEMKFNPQDWPSPGYRPTGVPTPANNAPALFEMQPSSPQPLNRN
jgi:hypothetical protein